MGEKVLNWAYDSDIKEVLVDLGLAVTLFTGVRRHCSHCTQHAHRNLGFLSWFFFSGLVRFVSFTHHQSFQSKRQLVPIFAFGNPRRCFGLLLLV